MIDEKAADTPLRALVVNGIAVTSRYNKAAEFTDMTRALLLLPEAHRQQIEAVYCNSKMANMGHELTMKPGNRQIADAVGAAYHEALCRVLGHYCMVYVVAGDYQTDFDGDCGSEDPPEPTHSGSDRVH